MNSIFEEAGFETTNFIIESGTLFLVCPLFMIVVVLRKLIQKCTNTMKENAFTRAIRIPIYHSVIIVRFFLEGCFGLGIAALCDITTIDKFRMRSILAFAILGMLIATLIYLYHGARKLRKLQ